MINCSKTVLSVAAGLALTSSAYSAQWSQTEAQLQYGKLTNAFTGKDQSTTILTLQHASGWKYGSNFFFLDHSTNEDGHTYYGEWYPEFSSNKIFDIDYGGPIKDVGLIVGFNAAPDADSLKYLPGFNVSWDIPGFAFFNTMLTAYIDANKGTGAPEEDDSYMLDVAWKYPFEIGNQSFNIQGHAEYISGRDFEDFPGESKSWILAQPQFRWDAGKTLFQEENLLYLGIEYQYWKNKLGTDEKDNVAQFLLVWVM